MRQPPGAKQPLQFALDRLVADEIRVCPRRRNRTRWFDLLGITRHRGAPISVELASAPCLPLIRAPPFPRPEEPKGRDRGRAVAKPRLARRGGPPPARWRRRPARNAPVRRPRLYGNLDATFHGRRGRGVRNDRRRRGGGRHGRARFRPEDRGPVSDPARNRRARSGAMPSGPPASARGHSPDRPMSNSANRSATTQTPRANAGSISFATWSRRAATTSSASPTASHRSPSPSSNSRRMASAPGDPPGSRVASAAIPARSSDATSSGACVDLPAPSPPSMVMKRPRAMPQCRPPQTR